MKKQAKDYSIDYKSILFIYSPMYINIYADYSNFYILYLNLVGLYTVYSLYNIVRLFLKEKEDKNAGLLTFLIFIIMYFFLVSLTTYTFLLSIDMYILKRISLYKFFSIGFYTLANIIYNAVLYWSIYNCKFKDCPQN